MAQLKYPGKAQRKSAFDDTIENNSRENVSDCLLTLDVVTMSVEQVREGLGFFLNFLNYSAAHSSTWTPFPTKEQDIQIVLAYVILICITFISFISKNYIFNYAAICEKPTLFFDWDHMAWLFQTECDFNQAVCILFPTYLLWTPLKNLPVRQSPMIFLSSWTDLAEKKHGFLQNRMAEENVRYSFPHTADRKWKVRITSPFTTVWWNNLIWSPKGKIELIY